MKKVIVSSIILIIFFIIPVLPYKRAYIRDSIDYNNTNLEIQHKDGIEQLNVVQGKENIKSYAYEHNIKNVDYNEVKITGMSPYKEISTFKLGVPEYTDFIVSGNFTGDINDENILTFKVIEWYPVGKYVRLKDTVIWHKYNLSLWFVYGGLILIIYICNNIRNIKLNRKDREKEYMERKAS